MFYSHNLLARKAPLGQIWMAATLHSKINRRKLNKLNIIKICEEILNPSVPMALRLSGILMGGVVIVYERKVKLLYDDVNRLLAQINEAWKVKAAPDPTMLPKGKSQAKREAITLPENKETDVEQSLNYSNATNMEFQHTAYFAMRLDNVDDAFIHIKPGEEDSSQNFHQADVENITLCERFDMYQATAEMHNRFERFDIDEDVETQLNFTSGEHTQIPNFMPSPPAQDEPQGADEIHEQHQANQVNQQSGESKEAREDQQRQGPLKRKTRRPAAIAMDYEQTLIPGHIYQSWLQDASDIRSRRRRRKKANMTLLSTTKIANLMEIPLVVLTDDLFSKGYGEIHYPAPPLLELWVKSTQPSHDSPPARTSRPQRLEPALYSPLEYPFKDISSGVGSQLLGVSIEKLRENVAHNDQPTENIMEEIRANFINNGFKANEDNGMFTPGNSVDDVRSIPSSASGHGILSHNSDVNSGRSQKRPRSSSRHSSSSLEPVAEENLFQYPYPNFKLSRLSEKGSTPDPDFLWETVPTQTQIPIINAPVDKITDSIRTQMKAHFETPGAPQVESLNTLAAGLNRKAAAILFYQTCVLATSDDIRVKQKVPYGEILISRGAKM